MPSSSWENLLKNSIKAGLIVPIIMPLVFNREQVFPFAAQVFFFQAAALIVLGLFVALNIFSRNSYLPKITPLTLGLVFFTGSFFISAFAGVDWHLSLWGSSRIMTGAVFMLFGLGYYLVMSRIFSDWKDWRWPLRLVAGVGGAVILLGIALSQGSPCQLIGSRMSSVLGNPVFLGGYAMMIFFLGLLGLAMERSLPCRAFFVFCSSLAFAGVLLSGTRSAMLGLGAGLVFVALWYGFKFIKDRKLPDEVRRIGFALLLAIFVLGTWQVVCNFLNEREAVFMSGMARAYSVDFGNRLVVWQGALEAWLEKPFLGWGPSNFGHAFNSHYQPESFLYGESETWPDGAWNIWLESLVERGIVGLLALFFLLGTAFWSLVSGYKKESIPFFCLAIGTAFLLAYLVHLSFIFELASMTMLFFLFLAFVNSTTTPKPKENSSLFDVGKRPFLVLGIFVFFLVVIFVFVVLLPEAADTVIYSAILALEDRPERAMEIYDKVAENIPTPYLSDLQISFFMSGLPHISKWERGQADRFVRLGLASLQTEVNGGGPKIIPLLRQAEIARQASYALNDRFLLKDAEKFLGKALFLSPKRQQVIFLLAIVKMELGNFEEAYQLVQNGIKITPTAPQGWLRLVWLHKMNNDQESAQRVFQEARDSGVAFTLKDIETVKRILSPECCKKGEIF